jgi:Type I phosphodiesterase / nucleotide pyrophosphatase
MNRLSLKRNGLDRSGGRCCTLRFLLIIGLMAASALQCFGQPKRLVIIKCDGLPYDLIDRFVKERDVQTGKSSLPWIDHIFYQQGARLQNFYVRGMSLSAPSWSLLDTGQHLQIKGNVEFDRYTLHSYDYLNFFPLYVNGIKGSRIDMPAVEVLDSLGIPLLADAYPHDERYVTFSLFLRGARYSTLQNGLQNRFSKSAKDLFDEWTMGFEIRNLVNDQLVREMIDKLANPKLRYLDLFIEDFDHVAHHNNDAQSQLVVLKRMDAIIGQVWTTIKKSPLGDETALVLVSDHGFNTDEKLYSQGFNLVKLLGSRAGGGHHVLTKRRLLMDYAIKGINPLVPLVTTTTAESYYLKGQSSEYPTAMLDFDGNERASIHLRDSDLNLLQILLQELQRKDLTPKMRAAATREFFVTLDRRRKQWQQTVDELNRELVALHASIVEQRKLWEAQPKKFTKEELQAGRDEEAKRVFVQLDKWLRNEQEYGNYVAVLQNLLSLSAETFDPAKVRITEVIPKDSMGDRNSIYQIQNYIVGLSATGLVLGSDGSLDMEQSFVRVNYFSLLHDVTVRNVQRGVANRPVDLIATRLSAALVAPLLSDSNIARDVVWINAGSGKGALLLVRLGPHGEVNLRYQPISNLTQDASGRARFDLVPWGPGLPLKIFEDPNLHIPSDNKVDWLSNWHTDTEWLQALHRTDYSNGLIGLFEELIPHSLEQLSPDEAGLSANQRLMRQFTKRQRALVEADMLLVANNHWNFDVRGFNPGGNHGSFFRISTHSIFMIAGGKNTQLPQGRVIEEPYDSLSFVPTLLALTGNLRDDSSPVPILWEKGFRRFPGRVVKELLPGRPDDQKTTITGASASP